jgi:hypothetical protein
MKKAIFFLGYAGWLMLAAAWGMEIRREDVGPRNQMGYRQA